MVVLSVRQIVVEVHVVADVNKAMTRLPVKTTTSACSRNSTNAGNVCRAGKIVSSAVAANVPSHPTILLRNKKSSVRCFLDVEPSTVNHLGM